MTPQEEIQAALATLTGRALQHPWYTEKVYHLEKGCRCMSCHELVEGFLAIESDGDRPWSSDGGYPELGEEDANLILIMQSLMEPSIAILRTGILYWKSGLIYGPGERNALALARSINAAEQKEKDHG